MWPMRMIHPHLRLVRDIPQVILRGLVDVATDALARDDFPGGANSHPKKMGIMSSVDWTGFVYIYIVIYDVYTVYIYIIIYTRIYHSYVI